MIQYEQNGRAVLKVHCNLYTSNHIYLIETQRGLARYQE